MLLSACAQRSTSTPQDTTRSFARAIQTGDYERAHKFLDDELGEKITAEMLESLATSTDRPLSADDLHKLAERGAVLRSSATMGSFRPVEWVYADGDWLLVGDEFWRPDTSTPVAALRTFIEAVEAENWDAIRATAPPGVRQSLSDETLATWVAQESETMRLLREVANSAAAMPVQISGSKAWIRYGDAQLSFDKDETGWTIIGFQ